MKKEIPILFSTEMVQAILEGRKTMTRRIVKSGFDLQGAKFDSLQKSNNPKIGMQAFFSFPDAAKADLFGIKAPYLPDDILWVKEKLHQNGELGIQYVSDKEWINEEIIPKEYGPYGGEYLHRDIPSIHCPKWAARIWLRVKDVCVERLQDISEDDAKAEGIHFYNDSIGGRYRYKDYMADASGYGYPDVDYPSVGMPICSFSTLWEQINGIDSWAANPWVWVVSFEVIGMVL